VMFAPYMLRILGADPGVVAIGEGYLRIISLGMVPFFFMFVFMAILQGAGDSFTPNIVYVISTILNIILDPIMIFGIGMPAMGVPGAALATVIAEIVAVVIGLEILLKGRSHIHIKLHHFIPDYSYIWRIIKIGIPATAQMSLRSLMMVVFMGIVASFGTYAIAAYGVGMRLFMLTLVPGFALANAAAALVGQNLGANKPERAAASAWSAVFYYFIFSLVLTVLGYIFAPNLIRIFNNNPIVVDIGTQYIRIYVFGMLFAPFALILGRAMGGAGDTLSPLIITFIALWIIQIPVAVILSRMPAFGLNGIWIAMVFGSFVLAIISVFWFNMGKWKLKKV
ncbi:MAG: MATE family efflux transporter, partial [Patescibacteria group bacterium]